jgi:toxin-antitoxin system, antitoxin component, hicB family
MTKLIVTAQRWDSKLGGGWELLDGDHAMTQVRRLSDARQQVIDYLDTVDPDVAHVDWDIIIIPAIPQAASVEQAKAATKEAADAQATAAAQSREVARSLRASGLSIDDAAWIMGVSRSRISQLARA